MASEDLQSFTKKMLTKEVFSCSMCNKLLMVPVMLVEDMGNVCHNCFEEESPANEWTSIPNTQLNTILSSLKFPCKFEAEGCDVVISYDKLKEHEDHCIYRKVNCLLSEDECEWKGSLVDLFKHFTEEHGKHVLRSPLGEFTIDLNVSKSTNVLKFLSNRNRNYVFKIQKAGDSLLHFLQDIKSANEEFQMTVKYVGNDQYKFNLKCVSFDHTFNVRYSKKVKLLMLQEIAQSNDDVKIVIKSEKHELKNVDAELKKQLTCPVCTELMRPPIVQCSTGHSVCTNCRKKLSICPTCREDYGASNVRNFSLEAVTVSVSYLCIFNKFGCMRTCLGGEIAKHEAICEYKMNLCFETPCTFTGNYASWQNHFKLNHSDLYFDGTVYQGTFTPLGNSMSATNQFVYFFQHNYVYKLTFSRMNNSCSWCMQVINYGDNDVKHFFKITISNAVIKESQMSKSSLCSNYEEQPDSNKIIFTYETLGSYKASGTDQINYSCEIF